MSVRSRRLFTTAAPANANTLLYTVPSGRTAVVRTLVLVGQSTTLGASATLLLNGTSAANNGLERGLVFSATETKYRDHWLCLNPGDTLRLSVAASPGSGVLVHGFGALLLGEPV